MSLPASVILVCAGADTARASGHGHALLDLCYRITPQGTLDRLKLSAFSAGNYIGISDFPASSVTVTPQPFTDSVLYEAERLQARGVFADLECSSPSARALCAALDETLYARGIPFFVPLARAEDTRHAILTAETAVSGGSLRGMIAELQKQYGVDRVAALLRPVCSDFSMPAENADGVSMTLEACEALRAKQGAQVFFSHELCAKYFTYMEDDMHGHFVLFDDDSTIEEKIMQLKKQGVRDIFALYPDVAPML
ncbi:MAG: hypothetical protein AB7C89_06700 [Intestinibacillus sp.]